MILPLIIALTSIREPVILFDVIELNHVYDPETLNIRFDQLLFRDRQGKKHVIEAWHMLDNCRDFDDEEDRKEWEEEAEEWLKGFREIDRPAQRKRLRYPGVYVYHDEHPWMAQDGRWTVRLHRPSGYVTIKARTFLESATTYDAESIERRTVKPVSKRKGIKWPEF